MTDILSIIRRIARPRAVPHSAPHARALRAQRAARSEASSGAGWPSSRGRTPTKELSAWTNLTDQYHLFLSQHHLVSQTSDSGLSQNDRTTYLTRTTSAPALGRSHPRAPRARAHVTTRVRRGHGRETGGQISTDPTRPISPALKKTGLAQVWFGRFRALRGARRQWP